MLATIVVLSFVTRWTASSSNNVLWGVPPSEIHLYKPGEEFACKDQKMTIPYEKVNDNYCDCRDGSDEPSTSACPQGVFYCLNQGYLGHMVPSSRVNDGVCDCCDGSDEYSSQNCVNTCAELELTKGTTPEPEDSAQEDEEVDESAYMASMVHMGTRKQREKLERLRKLELKKAEAEAALKNLEAVTKTAEQKANDAMNKQNNDQPENQKRSLEDDYAQEAFKSLDLNQDGILSIDEVKKEEIFDLNKDMVIDDREVKWYYDAMPGTADEALFRTKMWKKMGRLYVLEKKLDETVKTQFHFENMEGGRNGRNDKKKRTKRTKKSTDTKTNNIPEEDPIIDIDADDYDDLEEQMENMDDSAKEVIKEAMEAKKKMDVAKEKLDEVIKQKQKMEETLYEEDPDDDQVDIVEEHLENFGPKERSKYFPLRMHCYKYHTKDFVYKMCPFYWTTQSRKSKPDKGIVLGRWVGWGKENGEPIMIFRNGDYCEKSDSRRSAKVRIYCGVRNLLVHVEENPTCRYRMEFKSPAGCHIRNLKEANFTYTSHDEL